MVVHVVFGSDLNFLHIRPPELVLWVLHVTPELKRGLWHASVRRGVTIESDAVRYLPLMCHVYAGRAFATIRHASARSNAQTT